MDIQIRKQERDRDTVLAGLRDQQNVEVPLCDARVVGTLEIAAVYLEELLDTVSQNDGAFLCACSGDELLGFVVCWVEREESPNETPDSTTYGYMSDAFVCEQHRGKGIFRKLNAAAEDHLRHFPEVKRIRINVLANNERAVRAYRGAGYLDYELILEKKVQ